ncbi:MAG: hypothetical protein V5A39_04885 [Haloarculaceae archaeon]
MQCVDLPSVSNERVDDPFGVTVDPLGSSKMVPFFAGVFAHVVLQHWFQAVTALVFALVPEKFGTLIESESPAGVQCAVVDCE